MKLFGTIKIQGFVDRGIKEMVNPGAYAILPLYADVFGVSDKNIKNKNGTS